MKKSKYVQVSINGQVGYVYPMDQLLGAIDAELDDLKEGSVGDKVSIKLEVVQMTDEQYEKLSDFSGW